VDPALEALLYDPQTSGGLLLLVPEDETPALLAAVAGAVVVGRSLPAGPRPLIARA
jgi:hypothetical protein